jgi:hypothetical protein
MALLHYVQSMLFGTIHKQIKTPAEAIGELVALHNIFGNLSHRPTVEGSRLVIDVSFANGRKGTKIF